MSKAVRFDTRGMIRVGDRMRSFEHLAQSVGHDMGRVPSPLPPHLNSTVHMECKRLEAGVRSVGQQVQALSTIITAIAERVEAADAAGQGVVLDRGKTVLLECLRKTSAAAERDALAMLRKTWPDVWNSLNDLRVSEAADDLVRNLDPSGMKRILAAIRWPGHGPMPPGLKALTQTLRGADKLENILKWSGPGTSSLVQFLQDFSRKDLKLPAKLVRALESGALDLAAGKAAASATSLLLRTVRVFGRRITGWPIAVADVLAQVFGATKLHNILSGEFLFQPDPNNKTREALPNDVKDRLDAGTLIAGRLPPTAGAKHPEIVRPLVTRLQGLDQKIAGLYHEMYSHEPMDPMDYREKVYKTLRLLDERQALAATLRAELAQR